MFAVIRHYHFDPKNGAEIDKQVREGFVPLIRKAKGFKCYYWLDTGKGEGASFGLFADKAGADESIELAKEFVHEHLSKLMTQKPEIVEGPVVAHD
ncbi:MAG: hypothetical protein WBX09_01405 [Terracidiphilus sp.]